MFWRKKKKKIECDHLWHHVQDVDIPVDLGSWVEDVKGTWIVCSKCRETKVVLASEWERIERIQVILSLNSQN